MPDTHWTLLKAPFPRGAVAWDPIEVGDEGDAVLVAPRVAAAALRERFDGALGDTGWSLAFAPVEGGVVCTIRIGEVTKSAVADHASIGRPSAERTADLAFARAAEAFGVRPPVESHVWAPFDAESGVVLDDALDDGEPATVGESAGAPAARASTAPAAPAADRVVDAPDVMRESAVARGLTSEGQQMIDRLLERLKGEGQGLAAARLLVKHGGYGNDPASARELYTQLRDLLLRTGEGTAP